MGKIFGISDLPVSTIMTPFEPIIVPKDPTLRNIEKADKIAKKLELTEDKFIPKEFTRARSPKFLDMRNGIGKLMKHFSKKI
jgi:hypothetical protein